MNARVDDVRTDLSAQIAGVDTRIDDVRADMRDMRADMRAAGEAIPATKLWVCIAVARHGAAGGTAPAWNGSMPAWTRSRSPSGRSTSAS